MANNVKPAGTEKKPGVWKSFAVLMTSVKVPWVWVGLATLVSLFGAQLSLIIPDATAQVAAGDVSMGAILFMVGCMFLSALETSVRQIFGRIASSKTEMNFQKLMLKKNLSLPVPFFDRIWPTGSSPGGRRFKSCRCNPNLRRIVRFCGDLFDFQNFFSVFTFAVFF